MGDTNIPRIISVLPHTCVDGQTANGRKGVECKGAGADDDDREQDYDNGRASPGGVIVAAASAIVLVGVS